MAILRVAVPLVQLRNLNVNIVFTAGNNRIVTQVIPMYVSSRRLTHLLLINFDLVVDIKRSPLEVDNLATNSLLSCFIVSNDIYQSCFSTLQQQNLTREGTA